MLVIFFIADNFSASSRLRALQYAGMLDADGLRIRFCRTRPSKYLQRPRWLPRKRWGQLVYGTAGMALIILERMFQICAYVPRARVVFLQKDMLFRSRIMLLERMIFGIARLRKIRVVFDVDDAIYIGTSTACLPRLQVKVHRIATSCAAVLAGSEPILRELSAHNSDVYLSPTRIVLGPRPARSYSGVSDTFRLVWAGTAGNACYLALVLGALRRMAAHVAIQVELVTRLAEDLPDLSGPAVSVVLTEWSPAREEAALGRAHVALAPLADNPFTRAKCGGKLLSYFAAAIPVIASPVGAQAVMVRDGGTGLLAASEQQWVHGLRALRDSAALRQRLGQAGRAFAEEHYAARQGYAQWAAVVLGTSGVHPGGTRAGHLRAS